MSVAIALHGLTRRFGSVVAVRDLDLEVRSGEVFGFLGPNGAGKTTTIRCILGFVQPSSGRIEVLGLDPSTNLGAALARIGYVPGEFGLWPQLTGNETLDYLEQLTPRPAVDRAALADRFDLARSALERPVRTYSRGMRQKLALISAFMHRPELVILDEPTEGLDPLMQDRFLGLLRGFRDTGGTAFMSSHILAEVELVADRVGVIKGGELVRVGTPDHLTDERVRRCSITLRDGTDPAALLATPGVAEVTRLDDHRIRFAFRGEMPALLHALAALEPTEFSAQPPRLADAFLDLYADEDVS